MRRLVRDICRRAGVNDRNVRAFELFILDELDGRDVAKAVPSVRNTNNLYQIKSRIMKLLEASSGRFKDLFAELLAA